MAIDKTKKQTYTYNQIVLVGAGGTGGYLVPHVIRMCSHLAKGKPMIIIVDPDVVETKNCNRQNFILSDVGKYKAQVLAERYSAAFGYSVQYVNEKATFNLLNTICANHSTLIIDTIDNVRGRLEIDRYVNQTEFHDWISIGNTESTGQVVYISKVLPSTIRQSVVKAFPETFNEEEAVKQEMEEQRRSCADVVVSEPQSLAINLFGASLAVNLLYEILYDNTMSYHTILYDRFGFIKYYNCNEKFQTASLNNAQELSLFDAFQNL